MRSIPLLLLFAAFALPSPAQFTSTLNDKSVKGTFYVSVDDQAKIFVNGKEVYTVGGDGRSPEMELKTGDRVVVQLTELGGGYHFMMVFVSADGQTVVSFRSRDFKIAPQLDLTDFTSDQLKKWNKTARKEKGKDRLPVKSYSDWMWGELPKSILAGTITPQMFSTRTK